METTKKARTSTARKRARSPHQPTGCWIRKEKRAAIHYRDGFRCVYCCRDMHDAEPFDLTLDHVIPVSDGGSNEAANLVTACRTCNCGRRNLPLSRFCGKETRADIRRLTRRNLIPYLKLAKAVAAGTTGDASVSKVVK